LKDFSSKFIALAPNASKWLNTAALLVFALGLANVCARYLGGGSMRSHIVNSDTLFLPTLLSDLFANGGSLSDWSLPPAPYFFPDLFVFLISYLLGMGPYLQLLAFAVTQTTLVLVAVWLLAKYCVDSNSLACATFITSTLIYLALLSNQPFDFVSGGPFILMLVSVFHFGVFLTTLFFIPLWLRVVDKRFTNKASFFSIFLISALAFLTSISDAFFVIQTIVPLFTIVILKSFLERRGPSRKIQISLFFTLLSSAAGFFTYSLLASTTTRPSPHIGIAGIFVRLNEIFEVVNSVITAYPFFILIFFSYCAIATLATFRWLKTSEKFSQLDWLSVFSVLSILTTLTALLVLTNTPTLGARYLIPLFFWPIIVVVLFASQYLKRWFVPITIALSVMTMLQLTVRSDELLKRNTLTLEYQPSEIACIDEGLKNTNARNGVAQYWDARYLQSFSKLKLSVAQCSKNLDRMYFVTSKKYFRERYDFAISSADINADWKISEKTLIQSGGRPTSIKYCGSKTLYVFKKEQLQLHE
jgi:hypothetical protein